MNVVTPPEEMLPIGGVTPFSTVDCPGYLSAVVFFQGCPFRCPYCHNRAFRSRKTGVLTPTQWRRFLESRQGLLDTVVFSGGEPLIHPDHLLGLAGDVAGMGYDVALHTTGCDPDVLADLLKSVRPVWVGLDLKGGREDARRSVGGVSDPMTGFVRSLDLLRSASIPVEVRTTIWPGIMDDSSLDRLVATANEFGIPCPVWQPLARNGRPDPVVVARLQRYLAERRLTSRIKLRI